MTAQISDSFLLDDQEYAIVGVNGSGLFDPQELGVTPMASISGCWRGYLCQYKLRDRRLFLHELQLSLAAQDVREGQRYLELVDFEGPVINGVSPKFPKSGDQLLNNLYENLNLAMAFTGGILIGVDFIRELYVHMGFHPAWKYRSVFELIFEGGKVLATRNVSRQAEQLRKRMSELPPGPDPQRGSKEEMKSWVEETFRLDYDLGG